MTSATFSKFLNLFNSALILVFKLIYKNLVAFKSFSSKPKSKTSSLLQNVIQNGNAVSSTLTSTTSTLVEKAVKEIDNFEGLLLSLVKMGLILAYFYVCDRTNFFMKENK